MTNVESTEIEGISVTVNGAEVLARPGELLIDACERNGVYIPRFCYHPRMKPVGMCRMCLVEVDTGRGMGLQPSCMITCSPDMVVETESEVTKKAQDGVLEFLLINHPLDCPVCDKGGECPLQDQTMAYGPGESRFVEEKRHYEKPIAISDNVYLDRERCILCDRCTRFAKEVAGDPLIHFQGRGNGTEVNTFPDEPFSSYFAGNTVQICPVGALTAKPYRFQARPWDLEEVQSTATIDSVGSRITVQSSRNKVLRYLGVDVDSVNWGWLSDRERFSFEAFNHEDRLADPLVRPEASMGSAKRDQLVTAPWSTALRRCAKALQDVDPNRIGVIGGARLSNEAQYMWAKLVKGVLGSDNVDAQLGDGLPADLVLGLPRATIDRACAAGGTVVLVGPDPKEQLGALYLRLRHAVIEDGVQLIELTPHSTGLSRYATHSLHPRPGEAGALARALVGDSVVESDIAGVAAADVNAVAATLKAGGPVTVVLGRSSAAESEDAVVDAAVALSSLDDVAFLSALTRGNVHGALDMGLAPGRLPGRQPLATGSSFSTAWPTMPAEAGFDTHEILQAAADGRLDTLVLLAADPINDFPDADLARQALENTPTVIAVDLFLHESAAAADVVLAAAGPGEYAGSFTNLEGRISQLNQMVTPPGTARPDWILAAELAFQLGADLELESPEQVWAELADLAPIYADVSPAALEAAAVEGIVVEGTSLFEAPAPLEAVSNDQYALRLVTRRVMYDQGTVLAHSPSSAHLSPSPKVALHPTDFERLGVAEGSDVSVSSARGAITVSVLSDSGVPRGSAVMVSHLEDARPYELIDATAVVNDVRVEPVA